MRILDRSLAEAATYRREVDEPIYNHMTGSRRDISNSALSNIDQHRVAEAHKAQLDKAPDRARTSFSFCLGRIEGMLAVSVSAGVGTSYHYDEGDNGMSSR
jgi:hypothetical protein